MGINNGKEWERWFLLYCEKCKQLTNNDRCPRCGRKKLREAKENDPVYLITKDAMISASVEDILRQNNIPCQKQGIMGVGVFTGLGYTNRFFVPYGAYNKSKELLANFFTEEDSADI